MSKDTLYTINISHYSEFGRWCLLASGKEFEEVSAVPGAHLLFFPKKPSDGSSVPFMRLADGSWLTDSWAIAKYCFPDEEIDSEIKELVNKDIGVGARSLVYEHLIGTEVFDQTMYGASTAQSWFWWVARKGVGSKIKQGYVRTEEYRDGCREKIAKAIPILEEYLGLGDPKDSWDYDITAAKLAICSVFAPLVNPKNYALGSGVTMPPLEDTPEGLQKMVEAYRSTNLGKYILEFYKRNRVLTK